MPLNPQVINLYHQYLARLMMDHRFDINSQTIITLDDFPEEMPVERAIFKIVQGANNIDLKLTPDDIALQLSATYKLYKSIDDAKSDIQMFLDKDTSDSLSTDPLLMVLKDSATNIIFEKKQAEAIQNYHLSNEPVADRIEKFAQEVISLVPEIDAGASVTWEERDELHMQKLQERFQQRQTYGVVGPSVPWESMRKIMPSVDIGEVILFQMVTGVGKSTVLPQMAEYQALVQDYDVQIVTFETPHHQFADRQMARWCNINLDYLTGGYIDFKKRTKQTEYIGEWRRWMKNMQRNHGKMYYDFLPSASPLKVLSKVQRRKYQAQARGRQLIVYFDYLQVMPYAAEAQNSLFMQISSQINFAKQAIGETLGVPVFIAAQSHTDDQNRDSKNKTFGGQLPSKRSQQVWDGIRPVGTTLVKPMKDDNGNQVRDIYGNKRYWISPPKNEDATTAASTSEEIILTLSKANHGRYPAECRLYASDDINIWYNSRSEIKKSWIDIIMEDNNFCRFEDF